MVAWRQSHYQPMETILTSPETPWRLTERGSLMGRVSASEAVAAEARISPPRARAAILAAT